MPREDFHTHAKAGALHPAFRFYIDHPCRYVFAHGPDVIQNQAQALEKGLNCVALAHLLLKALFDYHLPADYQCIEMFYANPYLRNVPSLSAMQMGDVVFVGRENIRAALDRFVPHYAADGTLTNWREFPGLHVAVFTGAYIADASPLLLHANPIDNGVGLWSLGQMQTVPRYAVVYAIKRRLNPTGAP